MRRIYLVGVLWSVILASTGFLVLETSTFHAGFYDGREAWRGYYGAVLAELFIPLLAAIGTGGPRSFACWLKLTALAGLFAISVAAASMSVARPLLSELRQNARTLRLEESLRSQIERSERDQALFIKQNQRQNTALSAQRRTRASRELKELYKKSGKIDLVLYIELIVVCLLRFFVQISVMVAAHKAGELYRESVKPGKQSISTKNKKAEKMDQRKTRLKGPDGRFLPNSTEAP